MNMWTRVRTGSKEKWEQNGNQNENDKCSENEIGIKNKTINEIRTKIRTKAK